MLRPLLLAASLAVALAQRDDPQRTVIMRLVGKEFIVQSNFGF